MDDSELGRLVESYNTDLDRLTTVQSQALLDAWTVGWRDVSEQLARLQTKITQALDNGETVDPGWVLQRARLQEVNDAVARQVTAVAGVLGQTVPQAIDQAGQLGDIHARRLLNELDPYGIAAQLGGVNTPAVTNLTAAVQAGGPLDKVLAAFGDPTAAQARVRNELVSGIITGRNPRVTAQRIRQGSANVTLARAETIARTETLRAYRGAQQQAYDASPVVDGWTWLSAQNSRTCAACWIMTGSVHPTTEKLAGHVNCRCRMIPRTPSWESLGFTGLPDTNPTVPAGPETLAKLPADELLTILGADKYRRYRDGELDLSDMVTESDSPVWGRSVRVASTAEAQANAKARKAGNPTPGQVNYGPGSAPVEPPKAPPAPEPAPTRKRKAKAKEAPSLDALVADARAAISGVSEITGSDTISPRNATALAAIRKVGKAVNEEACRAAGIDPAEYAATLDAHRDARRQRVAVFQELKKQKSSSVYAFGDPKYVAAKGAEKAARDAAVALEDKVRPERNRIMRTVRDFGLDTITFDGTATKKTRTAVALEAQNYPREWLDRAVAKVGTPKVKQNSTDNGSGSYAGSWSNTLTTSKSYAGTHIHELGHWIQEMFMREAGGGARSPLAILEKAFLVERNGNASAVDLTPLMPGYSSVGIGLPDNFANTYTGRFYADGATEVLSTGMEALHHPGGGNSHPGDPDFVDFITGILLSL